MNKVKLSYEETNRISKINITPPLFLSKVKKYENRPKLP